MGHWQACCRGGAGEVSQSPHPSTSEWGHGGVWQWRPAHEVGGPSPVPPTSIWQYSVWQQAAG